MTYTIEYSIDHEDFSMNNLSAADVRAVTSSIEDNGGEVHDVIAERT